MGATPLVVVMGISGVGKSAVGHELADRFGIEYEDGDAFHSEANIAKMSAGTPLTDEDRWPWLEDIGRWLADHDGSGGVVSCSALRRAYRDVLVDAAPRVVFLHLTGGHDLIKSRMDHREHFMPSSLLQSQEETLEPLQDDERGWAFDITPNPAEIVDAFIARAGLSEGDDA
ncbi:gluconokinase [Aeromicrobium chenweiae]|uniref:Gluconokinase n=1 Tax=Aeromicrobium chenweiae TaxID=2079793 RepID=A0A2S0WNA9_9ACTN|nr:gluconokinase [Aeromicrobium chenweiae]AWB92815.1 gluconate kinase [Aeromicrobium chenweiae]TGN33809.1 gluconokinase [Aeromicrobium chenweiae]